MSRRAVDEMISHHGRTAAGIKGVRLLAAPASPHGGEAGADRRTGFTIPKTSNGFLQFCFPLPPLCPQGKGQGGELIRKGPSIQGLGDDEELTAASEVLV